MKQEMANPGAKLKVLRDNKGWTLADVARRTGLSISTISKIENNRVSLNFEKLSLLAASLGVDIAALLDRQPVHAVAPVSGRRSATRVDEGVVIETENYRHIYHATDILNKSFVPVVAELKARSIEEFGGLIRHPGEEFAYVIEGVVELHTDIYAPLVINTGESVFFDSGMGHAYVAAAPGPCRLLSIATTSAQASSELGDAATFLVRPAPDEGNHPARELEDTTSARRSKRTAS